MDSLTRETRRNWRTGGFGVYWLFTALSSICNRAVRHFWSITCGQEVTVLHSHRLLVQVLSSAESDLHQKNQLDLRKWSLLHCRKSPGQLKALLFVSVCVTGAADMKCGLLEERPLPYLCQGRASCGSSFTPVRGFPRMLSDWKVKKC